MAGTISYRVLGPQPEPDGRAGAVGEPCSIARLAALLDEAEAISDSIGLSVPSAHISKARSALRRSTGE